MIGRFPIDVIGVRVPTRYWTGLSLLDEVDMRRL
jgi:hypothetical protein